MENRHRRRDCKDRKRKKSRRCKSRSKSRRKDYHKKKKAIKFCLVLTGSQEVPPVETTGLGAGKLKLSKDRSKLSFELYFKNLKSPVKEPSTGIGFSHFHYAPAGQNGAIVRNISKNFCLSKDKKSGVAKGVWTSCDKMPLTRELVKALKKGNIYVNVHTEAHPGGEIRGQVVKLLKKDKKDKKDHKRCKCHKCRR